MIVLILWCVIDHKPTERTRHMQTVHDESDRTSCLQPNRDAGQGVATVSSPPTVAVDHMEAGDTHSVRAHFCCHLGCRPSHSDLEMALVPSAPRAGAQRVPHTKWAKPKRTLPTKLSCSLLARRSNVLRGLGLGLPLLFDKNDAGNNWNSERNGNTSSYYVG